MSFKNINLSSGQIAKVLLALVVVVIVAMVIAYIIIKAAEKPAPQPPPPGEPVPVYEATIGDIKFLFLEATDKGDTLFGKDSRRPDGQEDLKTTERFIELIVGAQNVGKENTLDDIWEVGEIIDSEGRIFTASEREVNSWLPDNENNLCGSILRPSFEPSPCKKIYEVAKISKDLKVRVYVRTKENSDKDILGEALINIKLMP
ncbi:MAG: hypothetical protein WC845_01520 [Candidatus Staskawiczbacteria bacterium]|jgi:hypothetical protein